MADTKQTALGRARARRVKLDRDRAARDNRVKQAVAKVLVLLDERAAAEQAVVAANADLGKALHGLTYEGLAVGAIAKLCDLDTGDLRRLLRRTGPAQVGFPDSDAAE